MHRRLAALALLASPLLALSTPAAAQTPDCVSLISQTEAARNIPRGLLMAIAVTESSLGGRPNPYAMNIAGRGYHATGYQDMANVINANWSRGVRSIDVGCMQINLLYHGANFARMGDLLDPATNVAYGANFLINLATETRSWQNAVMSYHNRKNPARRAWYGCKVWNNYLRINGAQQGYLACAGAPRGSTTASTGSIAMIRPARVMTMRAQAGPGPLTPPGGATPATTTAIIGDMSVDIPIPTRRPEGNLMIAPEGQKMPDIVNDDTRASAFTSARLANWAARTQGGTRTVDPVVDDGAGTASGFGRVTRGSN